MPTELDSLEIKLTSDANKATDAVDSLTDSLKRLKSASEGLNGDKATTSFLTGLADIGKKNTGVANLGKSVQSMADAEVKALSTVSEAATKSQVNIDNASVSTEAWKQDMQEVLGIAKTLVSPFVSLAKWSGKIVFKGLAKSAQLALSPIKKLISGTKNLFRSIARIAMYRAIRTFIKLITEGLKEGIDAMYSWSKETGGQFAASMDTIATKTHYIGRSLAAMLAPLINLAAVIIEHVTPAFVGMINVFNKFLATLTGQDYFTVAIEGLVEYGDTISGAADKSGRAAKEIRDAVVGIDELNIISQNTGSGSDNTVDGGTFVDEFLNENDKSGFAAQLAEAIGEQDWTRVGTTIAEKINDIFTDKTKIQNLSKKVGTFIKGALNLVSGLLGKVDFAGIGSSIAGFLNGIFAEFDDTDSYNLGQTLANAITAIPKAAVGFLTDLNWDDVASKLGISLGSMLSGLADFITETDWGTLASGLAEGLMKLVTDPTLWNGILSLGGSIAKGIMEGIGGAAVGLIDGFLGLFGITPEDWRNAGIDAAKSFDDGLRTKLKALGIYRPDPKDPYNRVSTEKPEGIIDFAELNDPDSLPSYLGDLPPMLSPEDWQRLLGVDDAGTQRTVELAGPFLDKFGNVIHEAVYTTSEDTARIAPRAFKSFWDSYLTEMDATKATAQEKWQRWHSGVMGGDNLGADYWDEIAEPWTKGAQTVVKKSFDAARDKSETLMPIAKKAYQIDIEDVIGNIDPSAKAKKIPSKVLAAEEEGMVEILPTGIKKWEKWHSDMIEGVDPSSASESLATKAIDEIGKGIKIADAKPIQVAIDGVLGKMDVSTFKIKGKKAVEGFNKGIEDNKDTTIAIVKKWMQSAGNAASMVNLEGSPSKLYAQKAKNVILGFNNEIAREGYTTANVVANWMKNVQAAVPTLTYSIDPSVLNKYASGTLETTVSTQTSLVSTGFEEGMERFYMTYLMPVLNQIALDTTTTANKPDPVIELDGRTLAKAVNNQNRINGYSFS